MSAATPLAAAFAADLATVRHPVEVPRGEGTLTLFVRELGYLELQDVYAQARLRGESALGLLVATAVEDGDGNRFSYRDAMSLRREVAEPLFAAVTRIQRMGEDAAKN